MGITRTNRAVFSSLTQEWATPQSLFDELNKEFRFQVDVAASRRNAKCKRYFTKTDDALKQRWAPLRCFMNPPYGRDLSAWMRKAASEWAGGATVVCLVPARTDTLWWRDCVSQAREVRFLTGRIRFLNNGVVTGKATFPSVVIVFGRHRHGVHKSAGPRLVCWDYRRGRMYPHQAKRRHCK